jgi:hypothetical protein
VPASLYEQVMSKGYTTITEAITKGFERLLEEKKQIIPESSNSLNHELLTSLKDRIESLEEQLKTKDKQLENKDIQIEKLNSNT